jgi:hypothetical protein
MGGAARARDDDLEPFVLGVLGEGYEPVGGAMRRNDPRLIADAERRGAWSPNRIATP